MHRSGKPKRKSSPSTSYGLHTRINTKMSGARGIRTLAYLSRLGPKPSALDHSAIAPSGVIVSIQVGFKWI